MHQTVHRLKALHLQPQNIQSVRNGYEGTLVLGLLDIVCANDLVIIIGSGLGITAAVACACGARVECFEGSEAFVKLGEKAVSYFGFNAIFHHAVVGTFHADFYGRLPKDLGQVLDATDLPQCDILQMDCEGAEMEILTNMTIRPREILVETHGLYGARTSEVELLLKQKGYTVTDLGLAEERFASDCEKFDIRVLRGERNVPTSNLSLHHHSSTDLVGDHIRSSEPSTS